MNNNDKPIAESGMNGWQQFMTADSNPPQSRYCINCHRTWTSRTGVRGFNRCPHCGKLYDRGQAERLVQWAKIMMQDQTVKKETTSETAVMMDKRLTPQTRTFDADDLRQMPASDPAFDNRFEELAATEQAAIDLEAEQRRSQPLAVNSANKNSRGTNQKKETNP